MSNPCARVAIWETLNDFLTGTEIAYPLFSQTSTTGIFQRATMFKVS